MRRLSPSAPIDLSQLKAPAVIETLDFEAIVKAIRDDLVERFPLIAAVIDLESQPARKLIEGFAYREMLLRARVNDAARATMLAYAVGGDLDHLGAFYGVARLVTAATDSEPATLEGDGRFRRRIQLAPEAFNTAGSAGAYVFHALTAAPTLADATAVSPAPGEVHVTLLGRGAAQPSTAERDAVRVQLDRDDVRPLTDVVTVTGPTVRSTTIDATLTLYPGPAAGPVLAAARRRLDDFLSDNRLLGRDLTRSKIIATLHVEGVQSVALASPATDVDADWTDVVVPTLVSVEVDEERDV